MPTCCRIAIGALVLLTMSAGAVSAHGKEVQIALDSLTPDPQQPLTRLYEARVVYVGDLEPVEGARLAFTSSREEDGMRLSDVAFVAVPNTPGVYVAQIQYPRFGTWDITLQSVVPGQGEATTVDHISPAALAAQSPQQPVSPPARLSVVFQFDWRDVLNIALRSSHSVGAATYLALAGVLLLNVWFEPYLGRSPAWRRLTTAAFPGALASLALIVASGVLTGYLDAPVRAPGVFNLEALTNVPYGLAYLAAFWLKLALGLGVLVVVSRARGLRPFGYQGSSGTLLASRLTMSFGLLVVLLLVNVVVLVYLHNLSHLSAALPLR